MRKSLCAFGLVGLFIAGCSTEYSDAMANARIHACELEKVKKEMEAKKGDKVLEDKAKELVEFLRLDQEMSGDSLRFNKEISEFVRTGCK